MKRLAWLLWVFGIPTCTFIVYNYVLGNFDGSSDTSWLDYAIFLPINVVVISFPQLLWAVIGLMAELPKRILMGGLIASHLWLVIFATIYAIAAKKSGEGDSIGWLLYFPPCFVCLAIGASVGHLMGRSRTNVGSKP